MHQLAFFPWIELEDDNDVGRYSLKRFRRGYLPGVGEECRATLDSVLEPYRDTAHEPVASAVILHRRDRGLTDDLSEGERDDLFRFAELFAFAALANREFFITDYFNRDYLGLTIQAFVDPQGGATVNVRQRDGVTRNIIPGVLNRVHAPEHVTRPGLPMKPDWKLLRVLLASRKREDCSGIHEGILLFNQANTDAPYTSPNTELVLSYAAMEQILGLHARGDQSGFSEKFADAWCPNREMPRSDCQQPPDGQEGKSSKSLRADWASDLKACRGNLAHGHPEKKMKSAKWTVREHLLLTSFAVPRLIKQVLSELGLYELTERDTRDIDAFESLLGSVRDGENWSKISSAWQRVLPPFNSLEYVLEQLRQP